MADLKKYLDGFDELNAEVAKLSEHNTRLREKPKMAEQFGWRLNEMEVLNNNLFALLSKMVAQMVAMNNVLGQE